MSDFEFTDSLDDEHDTKDLEQDNSNTQPPSDTAGESMPSPQDETSSENESTSADERIFALIAERDAERQKVAQLQQQLSQSQTMPNEPNIDDYNLDTEQGLTDWLEAQNKFYEQSEFAKFSEQMKAYEAQKAQAVKQSELENSFKTAFENRPNFKDNFAKLIKRHEHTPLAIDPSEVFDGEELMDVLEMLANDENLYYQLASMNERQALLKLGAIQGARQSVNPPSVSQSKAPKPPTHTLGNTAIKSDMHKLSDDDFLAIRGLV